MKESPDVGQDAQSEFEGALARVDSRASDVRDRVVNLVGRLGWPDAPSPTAATVERSGYMATLGTIEYVLDQAREALDRCKA